MKNMQHYVVLLLFIVTSCSSVAGLRDKSYTVDNQGFQATSVDALTILPIKDESPVSGLSEGLEVELSKAFQILLPKAKIVSAGTFRSHMAENDLINEYTQWRLAFDQTRILSVQSLKKWSQIAGTRYFLMVTKVQLSREKMKAIDTGYSG